MEISRGWFLRQACLIAVVLIFCVPVRAQEESSSSSTPPNQQEQQSQDPTKNQDPAASAPVPADVPSPGFPIDSQIHPTGKAIPWMGTSSPLRWGDFSVASFSVDYINDNFKPAGGGTSSTLNLGVFHSTIGFDRFFGRQHLVLQINPQVAILNGQLGGNAGLNNNLNLAFIFQLTPKLQVTVKGIFNQVHSRQLFPMDVLGVDEKGGNVLQNDFLQNDGSYWRAGTTVDFNYSITPRLLLTEAPSYSYSQTTNNEQNYLANGHTVSNSLALTYALTPRQNIGVLESIQLLRAANVPNAANTYFNTTALFYSYQIAKTWWIQSRIGMDIATYPNKFPSQQMIGGGGSLIKGFSNSSLAVTYGRGRMEQNFISASLSDRGDVTYAIHFYKRLGWYNGAGFYRDIGTLPQNRGTYASSKLEYLLSKGFSVFANYTYVNQSADTLQLLSGIRKTFVFGLGWLPPIIAPGH